MEAPGVQGNVPRRQDNNVCTKMLAKPFKVERQSRKANLMTVNVSGAYICTNNDVFLSESWKTRLFRHVITALATDPCDKQ